LTGRIKRPAPAAAVSLETLIADYKTNPFQPEQKYQSAPRDRTQCLLLDVADLCRFIDVSGRVDSMGRVKGRSPDVSAYVTLMAVDNVTKLLRDSQKPMSHRFALCASVM
jgi:hypothetical protein